MNIDFTKAEKELKKFIDICDLEYEISHEEKFIESICIFKANGLENDIKMRIDIFNYNALYFDLIFGKIEKTKEVLELLAKYNSESLFLKVFINEEGKLDVYGSVPYLNIKSIVPSCEAFLNEFLSDTNFEMIKELAKFAEIKVE